MINDYYPFGMLVPERNGGSDDYRYGYQGSEKDDEVKGAGNSVNYKFRMHDPRVGRFLSLDPLAPHYPHNSPYVFSENRVIDGTELEGLEYLDADEAMIEASLGNVKIKIANTSTAYKMRNEAMNNNPAYWKDGEVGYDTSRFSFVSEQQQSSDGLNIESKRYSESYGVPIGSTSKSPLNIGKVEIGNPTRQKGGVDRRYKIRQIGGSNNTAKGVGSGSGAIVIAELSFDLWKAYNIISDEMNIDGQIEVFKDQILGDIQSAINDPDFGFPDNKLNSKDLSEIANVILYGGDKNTSGENRRLGEAIIAKYSSEEAVDRLINNIIGGEDVE